MSRKIENNPSPDVLMTSMRAIGYSFKTALADIVDNSISAMCSNVWITVPINDKELFVSVLDDGDGMSDSDLLNAMKYGSDRVDRPANDLGRFGLGLKSASLSQCRLLTVVSKSAEGLFAYQWDLDVVINTKKWDCIQLDGNEINSIPSISSLKALEHGSLVVWQNFDTIYKKSGGQVRAALSEEMDLAEKHLALVFHRFFNRKSKPISIFVNKDKIIGLDPFLENHPKTDIRQPSEFAVNNEIIKVQTYILPHQNDLDSKDIEKLGGIESLRSDQGFYIYRNDRLIIYGTWFRMSSSNVNSELYKYGRIKVDIPSSLDELWEIDIRKQSATIPKIVSNYLKNSVRNVQTRSKEKTSKRARLTIKKENDRIWNRRLSRSNKDIFFINPDSKYVKDFLDEFDDADKPKIIRFLEIISSSIPFDDIYNSMCNKNSEIQIDDDLLTAIAVEGVLQFKRIKQITRLSDQECLDRLCSYEPYNNPSIRSKIEEMILHE